MPPVSVVIPWREHPSRVDAFEYVTMFYLNLLEEAGVDCELITSDSEGDVFNLAEARNRGVGRAQHEIVLLVDADSIATPATVLEAIAAADDNVTHYCYDGFVYLDAEQTAALYAGGALEELDRGPHESSVMVLTRHAYWDAGGMDERFVGWGGEDNAFRAATDTMNGPSIWHAGTGYSLFHDTDQRAASSENLRLVARYRAAWKNRAAMHALIFEDHRVSITP